MFRSYVLAPALILAVGIGLVTAPQSDRTVAAQGIAAKQRSMNNLKQIAIAMHNYHSVNDNFPPAAICDKEGKKLLSWRVAILPYLEGEALYKQFKLDEPWDSENNKKASATVVKAFLDPRAGANGTKTTYKVLVGKGAAFDWKTGRKVPQFTDGLSNSILVVSAGDAVEWAKPDDFEFDAEKKLPDLTKPFADLLVAMADGSVRTVKTKGDDFEKKLKAMITIDGGEPVEE